MIKPVQGAGGAWMGGTQLHLKATWRKCHLTWVLKHEVKLHKDRGVCANTHPLWEWLRIEESPIKSYFRKMAGELGRGRSLIAAARTFVLLWIQRSWIVFLFLNRNMAWSYMRFPTDWLQGSESRSSSDPHRKHGGPSQGLSSGGRVKGSRLHKNLRHAWGDGRVETTLRYGDWATRQLMLTFSEIRNLEEE